MNSGKRFLYRLSRRRRFHTRRKVPTIFQMEAAECGAAALAMILAYYHRCEPLEKLRTACGISRNGSLASNIVRAAKSYGLDAKGCKLSTDRLTGSPLPMILFWEFNHFVVLEGRIGDTFYINDPAKGPYRMTLEEFERAYTGIALVFEPGEAFVPHGKQRGLFSALIPMLKKVKPVVAAIFWAGFLLVIPGLAAPTLLRIFVDDVMNDRPEWLLPVVLLSLLTLLVEAALIRLEYIALRRGELKLAAVNTLTMLAHLFTLPMDFFLQRTSGDLQARISLNRELAKTFFGQIAGNAVKIFTALFFLLLMVHLNLFLSCIAIGTAILNLLALGMLSRHTRTLSQSFAVSNSRLLACTMTGIGMIETLRATGREDEYFTEWSGCLAEYASKRQSLQYAATLFSLFPTLLSGISSVLVLCLGSRYIIEGGMTLGSMMAFMVLTGGFLAPVNRIVMSGAKLQQLKNGLNKVEDLFHYEAAEPLPDLSSAITPRGGKLELRDISFGYSRLEPPLIEHFSLTIEPGKRIALVGASGSGKSTVAKLATGLYRPWTGTILLNDRPLDECSREEIVRSIASVDQNIMLFSGTVSENLTLFQRKSNSSELYQALRDASVDLELAERGPVLNVPVGELGNNLSGGQRQRLELARALARETPILILDEATAALDPVTESRIDHAIRRRGCSCLIVAHRLSTVRDCDEIILLDHGKIAERGTHARLMELNGEYRRLMESEAAL